MGNYYGKITCSHCYASGHNKRTCPARKSQLEQRLASSASDSGNSSDDNYYARSIARMTGTNPVTGEKVSRRNEYNGRTCSYCAEGGHNRRKCETLASDKQRYSKLTFRARYLAKELLMERGIAVGSMVKLTRWGAESIGMVCALEIQDLHFQNPNPQVVVRPMSTPTRTEAIHIHADDYGINHSAKVDVLGPLKPDQVSAQLSDEWLNSEPTYGEKKRKDVPSLNNDIFMKGARRDWHFWENQDRLSTTY
jgi:hypothetical protein